jgi:hypothetical protein
MLALIVCLACSGGAKGEDAKPSPEAIRQFLLTAKVVRSKQSSTGITNPWRLTLSDGSMTHDASFQAVDEHKVRKELDNGTSEINFVDSYKYNIAAYALAKMLGIDEMLPVYVERKWMGQTGSLSWWLPVKMDEGQRLERKLSAPDADAWNKQMYRIRVFDELVYDTDPNLTNLLIGEDWTIWRVDFSRAFRLSKDIKSEKNLTHCDSRLFEKIQALKQDELAQKTKNYLSKSEVEALMVRRDKIVTYLRKLIAQTGENNVLY